MARTSVILWMFREGYRWKSASRTSEDSKSYRFGCLYSRKPHLPVQTSHEEEHKHRHYDRAFWPQPVCFSVTWTLHPHTTVSLALPTTSLWTQPSGVLSFSPPVKREGEEGVLNYLCISSSLTFLSVILLATLSPVWRIPNQLLEKLTCSSWEMLSSFCKTPANYGKVYLTKWQVPKAPFTTCGKWNL